MIDVTLQIITASATHSAINAGALHLGGEVVAIHERIVESPTVGCRVGFGHINSVPVDTLDDLSFLLQENISDDGIMVSRTIWRVDSTLLTESEMAEVIGANELTSDWTRFKAVCKNVVTGLNLTDSDL